MANLFHELKRRHVLRVAGGYLVLAWLLLQITETTGSLFGLPDWAPRLLGYLLVIGFIPALVAAWVFELTPEGIRRDVPGGEASAQPERVRRLDYVVLGAVVLAIALFTWGRLNPVVAPASETPQESVQDVAPNAAPEVAEAPLDAADDSVSIAVLPFSNMSGLAENDYFSDGISEEILNTLVRIEGLSVASRTSAFRYRDAELSIPEIANELKVAYVLEGSVRRDQSDRVRITAQLIDAASDRHLWSNTYDREVADIFAVQEEIAVAIAEELRLSLDVGTGRSLVTSRTSDGDVLELYLKGRELYRQRGEALREAVVLLEEAVARDPDFAPAWIILGQTYFVLPDYLFEYGGDVLTRSGFWGKARFAREQARALDPDDHVIRFYHGWEQAMLDGRIIEGMAIMRDALAVDRNNDVLLEDYVEILLRTGEFEEARRAAARMLEIAPDSSFYRVVHGRTLKVLGDYEGALADFETAIDMGASGWFFFNDYFLLLTSQRWLDRFDDALARARDALRANPDWTGLQLLIDEAERWLADGAPAVSPTTGLPQVVDAGRMLDAEVALVTSRRGGLSINVFYLEASWSHARMTELDEFQRLIRHSGLVDYWEAQGFPTGCRLVDERLQCDAPAPGS